MSTIPQENPPKYEPGPPPGQPGYPPMGQPGYPPQPGYPSQAGYPPPPAAYGYPAPGQPAYPPGPVQPGYNANTAVVVTQPAIGPRNGATIRYTQSPALIVCQHCQATVTTSMDYDTGLLTWAVCGGICIVGCFLGCCLIPFCINATKDVEHKCPNCQNIVGRFRHFS